MERLFELVEQLRRAGDLLVLLRFKNAVEGKTALLGARLDRLAQLLERPGVAIQLFHPLEEGRRGIVQGLAILVELLHRPLRLEAARRRRVLRERHPREEQLFVEFSRVPSRR